MSLTSTTMIANTNQPPPRLHPKKRKFNPAELEEMEPTTPCSMPMNNGSGNSSCIGTLKDVLAPDGHATTSTANHHSSLSDAKNSSVEIIYPPATTSTLKTITKVTVSTVPQSQSDMNFPSDDCNKRNASVAYATQFQSGGHSNYSNSGNIMETNSQCQQYQSMQTSSSSSLLSTENTADYLDLSEWCNHRVLAKQKDFYATGIIRSVERSNAVIVEFDHPEGSQITYYDVFGSGRFDIISDASPSANDVSNILR